MLANIMDDVKRDLASFARDIEYLRESAGEEEADERLLKLEREVYENSDVNISNSEFEDFDEKISGTDDTKDEEVQRILESVNDYITFEEMIGI